MPRSNKGLETILAQCSAALEADDVEALIERGAAAFGLAKNGPELWDIAGREPIDLGVYGDGIFPAEIASRPLPTRHAGGGSAPTCVTRLR